jgi:alanyl-tRNA synthetase
VTERLYYIDSHLSQFEASVVDRADQGKRIYLDRTAFYPTSGGQPNDTGLIDGIGVVDVVDEGERIAHLLVRPLSNDRVKGEVNWPRRLDLMQQHSGQHLLSAVVADLLGYTTVSVHMGELSSTIDLEVDQLAAPELARLEERANQIIAENRPIEVTFEEAATAIGLRKPVSRSGIIRIVSIKNLDRSACGGTHVRATGEIGCILLRKTERVRKAVRVEFLCGLRAVRRSRLEAEVLGRLTTELSCSPDELPQLVVKQRAELKDLNAAQEALEGELRLHQAKELYSRTIPDSSGIRRANVRWTAGTVDQLRSLAQAFAALPGSVFIGSLEVPPSIVLSAAADSGIQAGTLLKSILPAFGGRGGGSAGLAQGVLPGQQQLEGVLAALTGPQ